MKERGIIFSGPMVRALLEGCKTQTRRIVKHQGIVDHPATPGCKIIQLASTQAWLNSQPDHPQHISKFCPYGQPGDRLWVREAHYLTDDGDFERVVYATDEDAVREHLDYITALPASFSAAWRARHTKLRPSIHMPRWASRILLELTAVRVERLQDISEEDARAEGVTLPERTCTMYDGMWRDGYRVLWESINGDGSWDANPWVWVISFKQIKP